MWLPVFKTGTHKDSSGRERTWTESDLNKIADNYNSQKDHEAPVVIGHPTTDAPAWGWVESLKRKRNLLVASDPSITTDSNDKVHISYWGNGLKHITNAQGTWQISIIDSSASYTSIAADSKNKVHISFLGNSEKIKYATNKADSWQILPVGGVGVPSLGYNSLALDSNDKVHIAYFRCGEWNNEDNGCEDGSLKYATNKSSTWQIFAIDYGSYEEAGWHPSIAVDSNDNIHISYGRSSYGNSAMEGWLMYATNASKSWQIFGISELANASEGYSCIAVDSKGKVHISYYGFLRNLMYATNSSGTWQIYTIDSSSAFVGRFNSIAIDSNNRIHISYY